MTSIPAFGSQFAGGSNHYGLPRPASTSSFRPQTTPHPGFASAFPDSFQSARPGSAFAAQPDPRSDPFGLQGSIGHLNNNSQFEPFPMFDGPRNTTQQQGHGQHASSGGRARSASESSIPFDLAFDEPSFGHNPTQHQHQHQHQHQPHPQQAMQNSQGFGQLPNLQPRPQQSTPVSQSGQSGIPPQTAQNHSRYQQGPLHNQFSEQQQRQPQQQQHNGQQASNGFAPAQHSAGPLKILRLLRLSNICI